MADGVTYEFKDLFEKLERALTKGFDRVDRQFDEVRRLLDGKADIGRVANLEAKLAELDVRTEDRFSKFADVVDARFKPLEDAAIGHAAVSNARRRVENALLAIAASSVGALVYIVVSGGVH